MGVQVKRHELLPVGRAHAQLGAVKFRPHNFRHHHASGRLDGPFQPGTVPRSVATGLRFLAHGLASTAETLSPLSSRRPRTKDQSCWSPRWAPAFPGRSRAWPISIRIFGSSRARRDSEESGDTARDQVLRSDRHCKEGAGHMRSAPSLHQLRPHRDAPIVLAHATRLAGCVLCHSWHRCRITCPFVTVAFAL